MRRWLTLLLMATTGTLAGLSLATTVSATAPIPAEDELLRDATLVFSRAIATPAAAIPAAVLMRAAVIAVIPAAVSDGHRYYGTGILSARGARPDYWTLPAVIAFEGTIPLDLETGAIDFIVIAQTRRGVEYLTQGRLASAGLYWIVAGRVGHSSPVRIDADLLGYMQFEDYFAGVTIDEWVVHDITASNATLYGRPYSTDDILRGADVARVPWSARMWRDAIAGYFREMS